jgi:hypothetical protein
MQNFIITLVFEKNANFFAENCQKSQKIVIITSTPGNFLSLLRGSNPGLRLLTVQNVVPDEERAEELHEGERSAVPGHAVGAGENEAGCQKVWPGPVTVLKRPKIT